MPKKHSKNKQPSSQGFFFSIGLFVIGITLFLSKLDSKENHVKPVQYTGLLCILSSSLSIVVGLITWIRQPLFVNHDVIQTNVVYKKGLESSNSGEKYKLNTPSVNNEDANKCNSNTSANISCSASVPPECFKKSSEKDIVPACLFSPNQ